MLSFFPPRDVLDEILDFIATDSECGDSKNHPVHSINALTIPVLRDCLPNYFSSPEPKAPGELI